MAIEGCYCSICVQERRQDYFRDQMGDSRVIICVRSVPGATEYLAPNLHTEWMLGRGWVWTPYGRMIMREEDADALANS